MILRSLNPTILLRFHYKTVDAIFLLLIPTKILGIYWQFLKVECILTLLENYDKVD